MSSGGACTLFRKTHAHACDKIEEIRKITPGGAGGANLEENEDMIASPKLNLDGKNFSYKCCSK